MFVCNLLCIRRLYICPVFITDRSKREIVAETPDGVPIMDEPYSVARAKNQSRVLPQPENIVELLKREHNSKELFSGWDNSQRSSNGGNYKKFVQKKRRIPIR